MKLHIVSKWSHDRSLSFCSDIYAPRYFIPNRKLWGPNPLIGYKKAQNSPKPDKTELNWRNMAQNKTENCDWLTG